MNGKYDWDYRIWRTGAGYLCKNSNNRGIASKICKIIVYNRQKLYSGCGLSFDSIRMETREEEQNQYYLL